MLDNKTLKGSGIFVTTTFITKLFYSKKKSEYFMEIFEKYT